MCLLEKKITLYNLKGEKKVIEFSNNLGLDDRGRKVVLTEEGVPHLEAIRRAGEEGYTFSKPLTTPPSKEIDKGKKSIPLEGAKKIEFQRRTQYCL